MELRSRLRTRMKIIAWVIGAFAVLVTFIVEEVDVDGQVTQTPPAAAHGSGPAR